MGTDQRAGTGNIEDFKFGGGSRETSERDGPRGGQQKRTKPNLAASEGSDSDEHQIFSQKERKGKLLLNAED